MNILQIAENCSIEDVRSWDMTDIDGFRLTKGSKFEPGAQGLALSRLANHKKGNLIVSCAFAEPVSPEDFEGTLLGGAFGLSLIRLAKRLTFGADSTPASDKLDENLTCFYRKRGGLLGKGQSCTLVCVDPGYRIPAKLREYARHDDRDFPVDQSGFRQLLVSMSSVLGFKSFMGSTTESALNAFVFECFVNSQEHGISSTNAVGRQSVRALLVEKVIVNKATKLDRLSKNLQQFIERSAEAAKSQLGLGFVCLTIADQGDGIQNTLPAQSTEESVVDRFARAFAPEVTRKPQGEIKRGLGLAHAISAAHKMRARIEIHSSGVHFVQDFSLEDTKYPVLDKNGVREDETSLLSGTTVSIWVPEIDVGLDQQDLFERRNLLPVEAASGAAPTA